MGASSYSSHSQLRASLLVTILPAFELGHRNDTQTIHHQSRIISSKHLHQCLQAPRQHFKNLGYSKATSSLTDIPASKIKYGLSSTSKIGTSLGVSLGFLLIAVTSGAFILNRRKSIRRRMGKPPQESRSSMNWL
jgi:hypothetical protein